jgi:urea ABC transporter ATP-binding protein UrtE
MLLQLSNLSSGYGRVRIVSHVTLGIEKGEILAVIGRNGVGKTTLLKTLIGSLDVMQGQIEFMGRDITRLAAADRARLGMGYVPQGRGIFSRMSVAGNLALGEAVGRNGTAPSYERVFQFFPVLRERLKQPAGSMSGGQQQQLAIGRILVGHPQIMLLDEPSEGIQPNIVQQIGQIIRRLRDEEALTIVIVEQNLELIQAVADRCAVMDKGAIVAHLNPAELADPAVSKRYLAI